MLKWILILTLYGVLAGEIAKNVHSPCQILINEVSFSSPAFLEVAKICPPSAIDKNTNTGLGGYSLVVVDPNSLQLLFHKSLERVKLQPVAITEQTKATSVPSGTRVSKTKGENGETATASKGQTGGTATAPKEPSRDNTNGLKTLHSSHLSSPAPSDQYQASSAHDKGYTSATISGEKGMPGVPAMPSASKLPLPSPQPSLRPLPSPSPGLLFPPKPPSPSGSNLLPPPPPPPPQQTPSYPPVPTIPITKPNVKPSLQPPSGKDPVSLLQVKETASKAISQSKGETQPSTNKASSVNSQSIPKTTNNVKGETLNVPFPNFPENGCSSQQICSPPPKKSRRTKRETEFIQQNVWALKDVDMGDISLDDSHAYVVALVYFPTCKRTSLWDRYRVGSVLSPEVQAELKMHIHDLVIISGTEEYDVTNATKILPDEADLTYIEPASELHSYSFSKCDQSQSPFNPEGFIHSERTKGKPNSCPVYEEPDPFSFRGTNLKIQTQKLVVNAVTNLRKKLKDDSWRKLHPVEAAASILNLSRATIYRIMGKYDAGIEFSEGKKQCRRRPTTNLEPQWQAILYKTITGEYARNRVARVSPVLKEFVKAVRTVQLQELEKQNSGNNFRSTMDTKGSHSTGRPNTITPSQPDDEESIVDFDDERQAPELYHCSARSFTKILDRYGYKYGKIRNRDSQIFRPVNLKWREMYLNAISKYEADPEWNVVYLDETWIDPHQRANRGIVLKKYANFQQRKDFTFKDDKISRGSRLIILAAGGADGFIQGATEVFAVSVNAKKKRTDADTECSSSSLPQDYHDNVKGPKFMQWLEKLFKLLETKKTVFVMDNCPFHKVLGIPKTSDKKEVIREWLEDKKAEGHDIPEDVSPTTKLTKMALLGIVGRLTTDDPSTETKIPRTQVQQLARQYGHRVLLLPPYNCDLNPIEYVWNDIKREVKEKNTEQTVSFAMDLANWAISVYTKEQWQKHIGHTKKLRNDYREGDKIFTTMQTTLDDEEAMAEELSDADYSAIDQEATAQDGELCVYEEQE